MDKVLILMASSEDVALHFSKLIQGEFARLYIVSLFNDPDRLRSHIEKLKSLNTDIIIIRINCLNPLPLALDEVQTLIPSQKLYMLDFCFSCCKDYPHENKNKLCLPPYITLTRMLISRIKTIFEALAELRVRIQISTKELNQLAKIIGIGENQIYQCMLTCLSNEEKNYHSIMLDAEVTSITATAIGIIRGSKEKIQLIMQYIVQEQSERLSCFLAHVASMLMILTYIEHLGNCIDTIAKTSCEEGLYTLYLSKLIEYGANFTVQLFSQ